MHLKAKENFEKIRMEEMRFILREITKRKNKIVNQLPKDNQIALMINGDMNTEPDKPTISQLKLYKRSEERL